MHILRLLPSPILLPTPAVTVLKSLTTPTNKGSATKAKRVCHHHHLPSPALITNLLLAVSSRPAVQTLTDRNKTIPGKLEIEILALGDHSPVGSLTTVQ